MADFTSEINLAAIEDALKARIEQANASGELGYKLAAIGTYGGEFDDLDSLGQALRALPAVWVVLADSGKPECKGPDKWLVPATFAIMVGARSVRNTQAARRGTQTAKGVEPGTYRLREDMWNLLVGQDLGLAIDNFKPGKTLTIFQTRVQGQGVSVLGLELHTAFVRTGQATLLLGKDPELERIGINYDLTPPGDGEPDATDLVTLQEGDPA